MPCDCSHMAYGYNPDDRRYGPHLYLHNKRDEVLAAGGILLAVASGVLSPDDDVVRSFMSADPPMRIACRLADGGPLNSVRPLDREVLTWISLHNKFDAARLRREAERAEAERQYKQAIAKLTPREIELLGLKSPPYVAPARTPDTEPPAAR